tara:strand:- start:820 stop:1137 length:318 start_codon:yes stop_codon:yes gene_type:complete
LFFVALLSNKLRKGIDKNQYRRYKKKQHYGNYTINSVFFTNTIFWWFSFLFSSFPSIMAHRHLLLKVQNWVSTYILYGHFYYNAGLSSKRDVGFIKCSLHYSVYL